MNVNKYAASKLKDLRNKRNLTQEELAEDLGITQQQIARYENNRRQFKQDFLFKLADYFQVSINEFFPNKDDDPFRNENDDRIEQMAIELGGQIIHIDKNAPLSAEDVIKLNKILLEVVEEQNKKNMK